MFLNKNRLYSAVYFKSQLLWMWFGAFSVLRNCTKSFTAFQESRATWGTAMGAVAVVEKGNYRIVWPLWFSCSVTLISPLDEVEVMCSLPLAPVPAWLAVSRRVKSQRSWLLPGSMGRRKGKHLW